MRISRRGLAKWAKVTQKCLNIGSNCTLCAQSGIPNVDICTACERQFRACERFTDRSGTTTSLCPGCGDERFIVQDQHISQRLPSELELESAMGFSAANSAVCCEAYCENCLLCFPPLLHRIIVPYRYAHPVDQLIKRIKYRKQRQLARVFGTLLGNAVQRQTDLRLPELLLPMPMHASRLTQRGYNQASDIAQWAGKCVGLPVSDSLVSRIVDTGSLAGLNRHDRQQRILGAFRASDALLGKRVAIVDDVLTTGASARELAREIYDCGAESVELWVLARTSSLRSGV